MPAFNLATRQAIFGAFTWSESTTRKGMVVPDADWVAANIVPISLPYRNNDDPWVWRGKCHGKVALSLEKAFDDLETGHLLHLIASIDGCYVPRHTLWDKAKPLSTHTWGMAIDLNAASYPFGSVKLQDPRLVKIMAAHGFACGQKGGGLWKATVDPMHFEYTYDPRK